MENSQTPFEREVASCIVQALNLDITPESINPEQPLFQEGLGLDSIDILEISLAVSKGYGVQLKADDPANTQTFSSLRSLAGYVESHRTK
ncbi:MAG TPA: phosphopantetheine-binding protein [Gammaproteobacteria bacterium]